MVCARQVYRYTRRVYYTCVSALERERAPRMEVGRLGQERRRKEGRKGKEKRGGEGARVGGRSLNIKVGTDPSHV